MASKRKGTSYQRREFLKKVTAGGALATTGRLFAAGEETPPRGAQGTSAAGSSPVPQITYPRAFSGPHLKMIAFPLGGIGTGTISLGGRGQLRDWEIFNRPDKGNSPDY